MFVFWCIDEHMRANELSVFVSCLLSFTATQIDINRWMCSTMLPREQINSYFALMVFVTIIIISGYARRMALTAIPFAIESKVFAHWDLVLFKFLIFLSFFLYNALSHLRIGQWNEHVHAGTRLWTDFNRNYQLFCSVFFHHLLNWMRTKKRRIEQW